MNATPPPNPQTAAGPINYPSLMVRGGIGGLLMGLANLVPGISGGTMLLASGVYPRFIRATSEVTRLKFRVPSLSVLAVVGGAAGAAILLLAGAVKGLVVDHRWMMFSLFIGLTLGGVPVVWKMLRPATTAVWIGAVIGFTAMAALALVQAGEPSGGTAGGGWILMVIAGMAGAGAMILPGVSGGYLLLVLGVYLPILGAIDTFKDALTARDLGAAMDPALGVLLPVAIGVGVGVVVVSNIVELLLEKLPKLTFGSLLGLLSGAVIGLWPFQQGRAPEIGQTVHGQVMTQELIEALEPEKYPVEFFTASGVQIAGAVGLIVVGFTATALLARFGAAAED